MTAVEQFAEMALGWLWQTSLAAAVLAAIVLALQAIFGRWLTPRWTYSLWMLVVLRLVWPAPPEWRFSLAGFYAADDERTLTRVTPSPPMIEPVKVLQDPPARSPQFSTPVLCVTLWLLGALCYLGANVAGYCRLERWVKQQQSNSSSRVIAELARARQMLGVHRTIGVFSTEAMSVPAVAGLMRPCLLLPRQMLENWSDDELRFALIHELVHVRRRDNVLNWGLILIQALHWFNPLVWLVLRRLRAEREVLCDSIVLAHLGVEERRSYGRTLIKAAESLGRSRFAATVVPILNHKQEIHRRIRMIARFKPTSRLMSAFAMAGVLVLACLTFTGAAQKERPARETPPVATRTERDERDRSVDVLKRELATIQEEIDRHEQRLEQLRRELRIPSQIADGDGHQPSPHAEVLRKLETLRIDAEAELQRVSTLHSALAGLPRNELRKIIQTAAPDQQLSILLERLADAEQKLASLSEQFAAGHPQVKALQRSHKTIDQQIDDRLDGILAGLKARRASADVHAKQLATNIAEYRQSDIEAPIRYRSYFQTKRELETMYHVRDRLHLRLLEERIDAALPRKEPSSAPQE